MIEIPIALMVVLLFATFTSFLLAVYYWSIAKVEAESATRWRFEYEKLNAKLRPEFQAAVDNLIPRTAPAIKRMERLKKALEAT